MDPSPEPPPTGTNPLLSEANPPPSEPPPDIPPRWIALSPSFPESEPIRAIPADYLPNNEQLSSFAGELRTGLQTLGQGPLDYRLKIPFSLRNRTELGV